MADGHRADIFDGIDRVEQRAWPPQLRAAREKFVARCDVFPGGFFVATIDGNVVGVSTSQITSYPSLCDTWDEITDSGYIRATHDVTGNALYVVSLGIDPDAQRLGIGGLLLAAQKALAKQMNLRWVFLGARMPGYASYCAQRPTPPHRYAALKTLRGEPLDAELRFYVRHGFSIAKITESFEPDLASGDWGAVMAWRVS